MKIGVFVLFQKNKIVTNLDLINGSDGSLDFNGGHHFEGFLDGGRAHLFVAESNGGAQGLREREKMSICVPNLNWKQKFSFKIRLLSTIK